MPVGHMLKLCDFLPVLHQEWGLSPKHPCRRVQGLHPTGCSFHQYFDLPFLGLHPPFQAAGPKRLEVRLYVTAQVELNRMMIGSRKRRMLQAKSGLSETRCTRSEETMLAGNCGRYYDIEANGAVTLGLAVCKSKSAGWHLVRARA